MAGDALSELAAKLKTPQQLSSWMRGNIRETSRYGAYEGPRPPQETFRRRAGNCSDQAVFAHHVLAMHGFAPSILSIKVESDRRKNHSVCVFKRGGRLFTIDNGELKGPFTGLEGIASAHDANWSELQRFDSLEDFMTTHRPALRTLRSQREPRP